MKRYICLAALVACTAGAANAGNDTVGAAVGGALGGATGAVIGQQIGGRDGAILGGAIGAAAGVAITTDGNSQPETRREVIYVEERDRRGPPHHVPPGHLKHKHRH